MVEWSLCLTNGEDKRIRKRMGKAKHSTALQTPTIVARQERTFEYHIKIRECRPWMP